ncbi:MAG: ABC transporter ATP-binding protein [Chloroflexi bacterium]|nr:ABC transporter ATP-binding protein [Chloroflexota bacterium]MBK90341.1 ABC transporter ATP-binding protein [Chloroflexota bacterium]|tara:strand:+ start:3297 stop:4076 length:780 start_codon:yes stop_codon:yes gene_type:complete
MSSEVLLKLENVHKHFGGVKAVNGVDFEVYSNRITGLIGPNGAGKSTIFNLITGFSEIDDGFIYFLDEDISFSSPQKTVDIGIVRTFQIPGELKTMSVLDNLLVSPMNHPGESLLFGWINRSKSKNFEKKTIELAEKNLEIVGLSHLMNEKAENLSTGQKKLLELGRILMMKPKLILLDEPAAGINPTLIKNLSKVILDINKKQKIDFLIIEHNMDFIMSISDEVIVMAEGQTLVKGPPKEIQKNQKVLNSYLGYSQND